MVASSPACIFLLRFPCIPSPFSSSVSVALHFHASVHTPFSWGAPGGLATQWKLIPVLPVLLCSAFLFFPPLLPPCGFCFPFESVSLCGSCFSFESISSSGMLVRSCTPRARRTMLICDSPVVTSSMLAAGSVCSSGSDSFGFHTCLMIFSILLFLSLASQFLLIWRRPRVSGGCVCSPPVPSRRLVATLLRPPVAGGGRARVALLLAPLKALMNSWMACLAVSFASSRFVFVGFSPWSGGFSFLDLLRCPPPGCLSPS